MSYQEKCLCGHHLDFHSRHDDHGFEFCTARTPDGEMCACNKFQEDVQIIYPPGYWNQGTVSFKGFVGEDVFGRKYIDRCPNNEHHLTKAEVPPGKERPGCRFYLDDLLSREMVGAEAEIEFEVRITPCKKETDR